MGGTAGMGGTTVPPECTAASECTDPGNECLLPACVDGQCTTEPVAADTPVAQQTAGDCQTAVCDGAGAVTSIDDDDEPLQPKTPVKKAAPQRRRVLRRKR